VGASMKHTQPVGLPAGIYFHLSNSQYHKDPALSHSGMTQILVSWQDYWMRSCHNPDREEYKPTEAMKFGDRSGHLLLDPKSFHEQYSTYGRAGNKHGGVYIEAGVYRKLEESVEAVLEVPRAKEHFTDGYPEVTIIWRCKATGIMMRCKIDYLRTFGAIDAKRIKAMDPWTIGRAVKDQGLDIQNAIYLDGITAGREWLREMKPKDLESFAVREGVALDWLKAFRDEEELWFRFLFQRSTPPWIWEFKELEDDVLLEGVNAVHKAKLAFNAGLARFGLARPEMGTGVVTKVSSRHVPRREYEYE